MNLIVDTTAEDVFVAKWESDGCHGEIEVEAFDRVFGTAIPDFTRSVIWRGSKLIVFDIDRVNDGFMSHKLASPFEFIKVPLKQFTPFAGTIYRTTAIEMVWFSTSPFQIQNTIFVICKRKTYSMWVNHIFIICLIRIQIPYMNWTVHASRSHILTTSRNIYGVNLTLMSSL